MPSAETERESSSERDEEQSSSAGATSFHEPEMAGSRLYSKDADIVYFMDALGVVRSGDGYFSV
jgi:hypothetical protein